MTPGELLVRTWNSLERRCIGRQANGQPNFGTVRHRLITALIWNRGFDRVYWRLRGGVKRAP